MRISDWSSDVCSSDLQVVVGVVAAAVLARKGGRAYQQLAVVDLDELLLQQSLVDRAQVLHGQIAVVDEAAAGEVGTARETVDQRGEFRSEEHTSELQSLMRISYAVFCLKKKITTHERQ